MKYFDCDCMLGIPKVPIPGVVPDIEDLLSEMKRLDIVKALVRHRLCIESFHETGNIFLMEQTAGHENLIPVWYVTPDGLTGEFKPELMVERMLSHGIRAAWLTTKDTDAPFSLELWCSGKMLKVLEEHRVPLLIPYSEIPPEMLNKVLGGFPELPLIILETPRLGRNPVVYSLMERHKNLFLCTSALYGVHMGLEDLCRNFGAERILFGSSYPKCEGGASISFLNYSDLPDYFKEAIAYTNLDRIIMGVRT